MTKFKLCAFADEADAQIDMQIKALSDNGIPCIELRGVNGRNISELTLDEAKALRKQLDNGNISVWSIGSPIGKISITDDFAPHYALFLHVLELAKILGASCIRMFSFYVPSGKTDTNQADTYKDKVFSRLTQFSDAAKDIGITLCHENEKGIFGDNAERCAAIHAAFGDIKAVFDPANFVQCGQDTAEAWALLAPYVQYLHIKDAFADGAVVPAGHGDGNLREIIAQFGVNGGAMLSVEPHLAVFSGLDALENGEKSVIGGANGAGKYEYPSGRAAFDAAVAALREII